MFIELKMISDASVHLKNVSLYDELNAIKSCEGQEYLLSKGIDHNDLEFKAAVEIVSINLDQVLYIKPKKSKFSWGFVATDERLMLPFTEVIFTGRASIYVAETYEELTKKFNISTSE